MTRPITQPPPEPITYSFVSPSNATDPHTAAKPITHRQQVQLAGIDLMEMCLKVDEAKYEDMAKGWFSSILTGVDKLVRHDGRTRVDDAHDQVKRYRDLIADLRGQIQGGQAKNIQSALRHLAERGNAPVNRLAMDYLHSANPIRCLARGDSLPRLLHYLSAAQPDEELANAVLIETSRLAEDGAPSEFCAGIFRLVQATSRNAETQNEAAQRRSELKSKKGIKDFAWDMLRNIGPDDWVQIAAMSGASKLGTLAGYVTASRASAAGFTGWKALALVYGAETLAEASSLWAMNHIQASAWHDTKKILSPDLLLKSYGATLLMVSGQKVFGTTHPAAGAGGMVATTQLNQVLGLQDTPEGGLEESVAYDLLSYVKYGIAQRGIAPLIGAHSAKSRRLEQFKQLEIARLTSKWSADIARPATPRLAAMGLGLGTFLVANRAHAGGGPGGIGPTEGMVIAGLSVLLAGNRVAKRILKQWRASLIRPEENGAANDNATKPRKVTKADAARMELILRRYPKLRAALENSPLTREQQRDLLERISKTAKYGADLSWLQLPTFLEWMHEANFSAPQIMELSRYFAEHGLIYLQLHDVGGYLQRLNRAGIGVSRKYELVKQFCKWEWDGTQLPLRTPVETPDSKK